MTEGLSMHSTVSINPKLLIYPSQPLSLSVTISMFSMSADLLLFYTEIHLCHFFRFYTYVIYDICL